MPQTTRTFRIFVSSPFTDVKKERNALQEKVFPRLRELCHQHGARFQAIDLRWGVSEEASLDQQTVKICISEIERCQKTTPRPNFIVLLGDRYGWRPLPAEIPKEEFEMILNNLSTNNKENSRRRALVKKWYRLDENAIPAVYCLLPREGKFKNYDLWERIEQDLSVIFRERTSSLPFTSQQRTKYEASATEQEIIQGIIKVQDAHEHVFCFFRRLEGLKENLAAKDFWDLDELGKVDYEAQNSLQKLKDDLRSRLPETVFEYNARWTGKRITTDHISELCKDAYDHLSQIIRKQVDQFENIDPLEQEIAAHDKFGKDRAKFFTGRIDILKAIDQYVNSRLTSKSNRPLVIYGRSGSGKSALMAHAIEEFRNNYPSTEVVSRFIGATPESINGRALLESLCKQISRIYGVDESTIPTDYKELIEDFPKRLESATAEKPLVIFLDALDQLSDMDNARNLIWLPAKLPAHVRLVVSILAGNDSKSDSEILSSVKRKLVKSILLQLKPMSIKEGSELLDRWLKEDARRILQIHQQKEILDKFSHNGLPLYLRLAFEEARRWRSYTNHTKLNSEIPGIILDLFRKLSNKANHGKVLVSRSLEYLGASKNGLGEDELLDVLSEDKNVVKDFKRRSPRSPNVNALPVIVWSRLYFDLEPYLTKRSADGTSLLSFFHRQFVEVVRNNYLIGKTKIESHHALAHYFGKQDNVLDNIGKATFNLRKLSELPYQQRKAKMWKKLETILCDLSFIESKCAAGMIHDLITDYNTSLESNKLPLKNRKNIESFARFIRAQSHVLAKHSALVLQQAFNEPDSTLPAQIAHQQLEAASNSRSIFRCVNKSQIPSYCLFTLSGHTKYVNSCDISPDGKNIVSASSDGTLKIWDAENGKEISTLEGHNTDEDHVLTVSDCRFSPDAKRLLSADRDGRMMLWDPATGNKLTPFFGDKDVESECNFSFDGKYIVVPEKAGIVSVLDGLTGKPLFKFKGHKFPVKSCRFSPDNRRIVSGDTSGQIILWNIKTQKIIARAVNAHKKTVWRCKFFDNGKWIVSASQDGTLKLWDAKTLKEIGIFAGHKEAVWACDVSRNGKWIVSGSFDKTLKIWDVKQKLELDTLEGHEGQIWDCTFFPDGKRVVSACYDTTLKIWDVSYLVDTKEVKEKLRFERNKEESSLSKNISTSSNKLSSIQETKDGGDFGPILCSAISPDNRIMVSGSWDGWLRRWEMNTGTELKPLHVHKGYITALSFSPDGKLLLIGDDGGQLKLLDTFTWTEGSQFQPHSDQVTACSFSIDGKKIISAGDDELKIWNLNGKKVQLQAVLVKGGEPIGSCAFLRDGSMVAAGTEAGRIRLFNVATMKEERSFSAHNASVLWCAFSPKINQLLSTSMDGTMKLWDLGSSINEPIIIFDEHTDAVQTGYFSKDGNSIVSASWDRTLKVWNVPSKKFYLKKEKLNPLKVKSSLTLYGHTDELQDGRFSPDGERIVSASMDGTVRLWDAENCSQIAFIIQPLNCVKGLAFSPLDGKRILSYSHNRSLKLWDGFTGIELMTLLGHKGEVQAGVFSPPDGKQILSASSDNTLKLWDTESGRLLASLKGHSGPIQSCDFSPDGKWIVSASWDRTIKLWDAETYTNIDTIHGHSDWIQQVMFSPADGRWILSRALDKTIKIWDANSRSLQTMLVYDGLIETCATSRSSNKIVSSYSNKLRLWKPDTQNDSTIITDHKGTILCSAFSPDGSKFVSGSADHTLKLWDANTGSELTNFRGHSDWVLSCALSLDGTQLLSGSKDYFVKLWDVKTGKELCQYWVGVAVHSVGWHPSGKLMVAGDGTGNIHLLSLQSNKSFS
jgi:WD40 repeat protein/AAA+ ATPase superfamily predicted ATPase